MTEFCLILGHSLWFATILNSLKTNIFARLEYFSITPFQTMQSLSLWKNTKRFPPFLFNVLHIDEKNAFKYNCKNWNYLGYKLIDRLDSYQ